MRWLMKLLFSVIVTLSLAVFVRSAYFSEVVMPAITGKEANDLMGEGKSFKEILAEIKWALAASNPARDPDDIPQPPASLLKSFEATEAAEISDEEISNATQTSPQPQGLKPATSPDSEEKAEAKPRIRTTGGCSGGSFCKAGN